MLAILLGVLLAGAVDAAEWAAGYRGLTLPAAPAGPAGLWYPAAGAAEAEVAIGPHRARLAAGAPLAGGARWPVILLSHGTGGAPAAHHHTAAALARAGFVALAVTHAGDTVGDEAAQGSLALMARRAAELSRALDWLLGESDIAAGLDPGRVGVFGFSAGGATALILAGAVPEAAALPRFCATEPEDALCRFFPGGRFRDQDAPPPRFAPDPRIRAVVAAAPGPGFLFVAPGALAGLRVPVQLWRPEADALLRHPHHAEAIRRALPVPPEFVLVPAAGHYAFLAPCPARLAAAVPEICEDPPGFDRVGFHPLLHARVADFFRRSLAPPP